MARQVNRSIGFVACYHIFSPNFSAESFGQRNANLALATRDKNFVASLEVISAITREKFLVVKAVMFLIECLVKDYIDLNKQ